MIFNAIHYTEQLWQVKQCWNAAWLKTLWHSLTIESVAVFSLSIHRIICKKGKAERKGGQRPPNDSGGRGSEVKKREGQRAVSVERK